VTGCPAGFTGKFSFSALLTNKVSSPALSNLALQVVTLTNGNALLDPQNNGHFAGIGDVVSIRKQGMYADNLLGPGESVNMSLVVCLRTRSPFQFFVDVLVEVNPLVDQSNIPTWDGAWLVISKSTQNVWAAQTFTPTRSTLTGVDIDIVTANPSLGP
jgi:hypothetical protein